MLLFSALLILLHISFFLTDLKSFKKKPKLEMIHPEKINAIGHHDGLYDGAQINHPRAAHNLLGYKTECLLVTK